MAALLRICVLLVSLQCVLVNAGPCTYCLSTGCQCNACRMAYPCNTCCGNHSTAVELFGDGIKTLSPDQYVEHSFILNADTEWLTATEDNSCLQIPAIMKSESIFCHGPFPTADFNEFQKPWESGKGSCADQGFDQGPQNSAANVTDQTDMHVCHFTSWDFAHPLPVDQRESSWYKKVRFGDGIKTLTPDQYVEHSFILNADTEWLTATEDNSCLQIPAIMKSESIFCHGPFPTADFNEFQKPWQSGKGSCADQGFDQGPQNSAANVTDQTDMHVCHFTSWDFAHPLPVDQRESSWYKKVRL